MMRQQQGCQEVVEQDAGQDNRDGHTREFRQQACRPRHEDSTDEYQQHYGEHAHDEQHRAAHVMADDLGNTLAILTQGNHSRKVVVDATGKNRTEDNPKVYRGPPKRTAQSTEDRAQASDVEQLDHENTPGRQGDVVNAVVMDEGRCRLVGRAEQVVDYLAIDEITTDKCQ